MPASSERSISGDGGGVKVDGNRMNFDIPSGLTDLLQDFTVAVLRSRPSDLHQFAAGYFNGVYERRQQTTKNYDVNNGIEGTSSLSSSSSHAHSSDGGHVGDGANTADRTSTSDPAPPTVIASTPTRQHSSDDDMPLEPPPVTACTRRKSVAAERYDPEADHDDGIKVTHPKSAEQRNRLNDAVKHILLFRSLEEKQLLEVIDAMFERKVCAGEHVIKEGDDGDNFYVIDSGVYDILVNGKKVGVYDNMGSFGELALMYNMPRAATIVAVTDGNLWAMDRSTFRRIVLKNAFNKRKMYEALLESVPLLKSLDMYERMNIADALVSKQFNDGDVVIKQGDAADCMFFIEDGEVKIAMKQSVNDPEREVTRCNKGGYFGELALVTHKPRAASAYAVGSVRLAVLDVAAFERVLGPCMDIMKRNIETYEEQLIQIFGSKITIADDI